MTALAGLALVLLLVVLPTALHGWPDTVTGWVFFAAVVASGLTLIGWRHRPRAVTLAGASFWLLAALLSHHGYFPDPALIIMALLATVAALAFRGRAAWITGGALLIYSGALYFIIPDTSPVALFMFSVPGFFAGSVLRLRREAAETLARRSRELEEERELFADLALRHERARIAAELHDIVGHAISVMIIQAAGQRLVGRDPVRAGQSFEAIAESARQGRADLQRLVELLGGTEVGGPDLALIEELVTRAARSGLDVTCRFEGDHDGVAAPVAHVALRVVQESLTNALRYAPGAAVRVLVRGSDRHLTVRVENAAATRPGTGLSGTGRGLTGLRERVQQRGGHLTAGPTAGEGWLVEATLPG